MLVANRARIFGFLGLGARDPGSFALHCSALLCIALHCISLHCIALLCIALYCFALLCFALHCFALLRIALHCLAMYCIALHCFTFCIGALDEWVHLSGEEMAELRQRNAESEVNELELKARLKGGWSTGPEPDTRCRASDRLRQVGLIRAAGTPPLAAGG